jgi:hypothetical protein
VGGVVAMLVISIILEAAVAILAILAAARKGNPYIYGLAFTFGAYVLYDLARLFEWNVQGAFFPASSCSQP